MIHPVILIVAGIAAMILCVMAWCRYRGAFAPVPSEMFIVMAGGAMSIALFYVGILLVDDSMSLVSISRWIWLFILLSTAFMAISVLVVNRGNGKNGR